MTADHRPIPSVGATCPGTGRSRPAASARTDDPPPATTAYRPQPTTDRANPLGMGPDGCPDAGHGGVPPAAAIGPVAARGIGPVPGRGNGPVGTRGMGPV